MPATTKEPAAEETPRTGHRPGRNPEEPRNSTVCCTVSASEQAAIDALSYCTHRRRSAILTEIITRFMAAAESPRGILKKTALLDYLEECQASITEKRDLFDSLTGKV
jgi:hypothetical protein